MRKVYCPISCEPDNPHFVAISQATVELQLFPVWKTNSSHIETLRPLSILTCQSSSASHSASAQQISCESNHWRLSYDVLKIYKMAAVDVANELLIPLIDSAHVLRRSGSLRIPTFVKIPQSTAEL